jgi:proline dehydrogenase
VSVARRALFLLATSSTFGRVVRALPGAEERAWRSARRYVAGRTAADALAIARDLAARGLGSSLDLFGEDVTDPAEAGRVTAAYVRLARTLEREPVDVWLSLDLSHVAFDPGLLERIATALPPGRRVQVGAQEAAVADEVLRLVLGAAARGLPVTATVQANLRRSRGDAERLAEAGVPVRLVKGAYVEPRDIAFPWGVETDTAYAELARMLGAAGVPLALATHDRALRAPLLAELPDAACELLLGVHPEDAEELARRGRRVRVYVPFGEDWFRYFMRRRAEAQGA